MTEPQGRAEIRGLLARHGHHPNKSLGQHFLADPNLVDRIVRTAAVGQGDRVVEIGAGTGTLTRALAATGAQVVAYEVDRHLEPLLVEALADIAVELRIDDAATADLQAALGSGTWVMVANLPYNVGTTLILDVLQRVPRITRLVVMVQREVADRLLAGPGSRIYGLPSVIVALRATGRLAFSVGREVFHPPPDVESAVVVLERVAAPIRVDRAEELAAAAFGQRRKMLRRSLRGVVDDVEETLRRCGVDPATRPEQLRPEDFVAIAGAEA